MEQKNWHEKVQTFLKQISESNKTHMTLYGLGILLVAIVIFQTGILIGMRKASFMNETREHYPINQRAPVSHGAAGKIISISLPSFILADQDNTEKTIFIKQDTIIRALRNNVSAADLSLGDSVVVIGTPNPQGQILANFIRVIPEPGTIQ